MEKTEPIGIYGLMAEYDTADAIVEAAKSARAAGFTKMDGFTPFPLEELIEALGVRRTRLPWIVMAAGLIGCVGGFMMQYWMIGIDYPLNVGGRPLLSWVSFIPITFELTILLSAATAVISMLALNGFPQPYHPVFNVPRFALASRDRFFLLIESNDPKFDAEKTRDFLLDTDAREVSDVEY